MEHRDYYRTLAVDPSATKEEIKKAFRRSALRYHPDRAPGDDVSERKFKEAAEAYAVLADDEKRRRYDLLGSQRFGRDNEAGNIFGSCNFEDILRGFGLRFDHDISRSFFRGRGMGRCGRRGGGGRRCGRWPASGSTMKGIEATGRDLLAELVISQQEATIGCEKTVALQLGGYTEELLVKIPPGVSRGTRLRLRSKGLPGPDNGEKVDVYLVLNIRQ